MPVKTFPCPSCKKPVRESWEDYLGANPSHDAHYYKCPHCATIIKRREGKGNPERIPRDVLFFLCEEIAYKWVYDWSETWFYHTIMRFHGDVKEGKSHVY